jgi:hypothetical protein
MRSTGVAVSAGCPKDPRAASGFGEERINPHRCANTDNNLASSATDDLAPRHAQQPPHLPIVPEKIHYQE